MSADSIQDALAAHQRGEFDQAERGYRALLARGGDSGQSARRLLGVLLLQTGRDAEAVEALQAALADAANDVELLTNLSIALRRGGDAAAAVEHARRAVELAPQRPAGWNAQGLALLDAGQAREAAQVFEQALAQFPQLPALQVHLGQALLAASDAGRAAAAFQAALSLAPDIGEAWQGLGRAQAKRGALREAVDAYQRASALLGPEPGLAVEFGAVLCAAGRHAEGQALLRGAIEAQPDDAEAWYALGRSLLVQREPEAAAEALARAAAIEPDNAVIRHLLSAARGETSGQVDSAYVRSLYEDFADRFETTLVGALGYSVPQNLAHLLREQTRLTAARVLDLGCGTGLMGVALGDLAGHLEGVDLSPAMLRQAEAKGLYAGLHEAEIVEFLQRRSDAWDLVVAADVVMYVGALEPLCTAAHAALRDGGWLAFSAEAAVADAVEVDPSTARHRHGRDYVQRCLRDAGFETIELRDTVLRREAGQETAGYLILARKLGIG